MEVDPALRAMPPGEPDANAGIGGDGEVYRGAQDVRFAERIAERAGESLGVEIGFQVGEQVDGGGPDAARGSLGVEIP